MSKLTLDFSRLKTPAGHGDVLVVPEPTACVVAARDNADALRRADAGLLDSTLGEWRKRVREAIVGHDDVPVIVTGHQPAFIHPGVWVKHVVAMRLASALGGRAINLVVDCDAPKETTLSLPCTEEGKVVLRKTSFAELPIGLSYEQIGRKEPDEISRFEQAVRDAMGKDRYRASQMPKFFAAMGSAGDARDWVDQAVAARRSIEADFDVVVDDRRISRVWCGPLLADMLINACRFATSYNKALAAYRRANRVRGSQRPIPDLSLWDAGCEPRRDRKGACEVPLWAYQAGGPRHRVWVTRADDSLRLFAEEVEIGEISVRALGSCELPGRDLAEVNGWRIRPRALALTLWARLLLADLFIHGIGGAKYDRISDAIMSDYYGLAPPRMACVSATLHLALPAGDDTMESVRAHRHALRDLEWNPHRNLPRGPDLDPLIWQRSLAVARAVDLRRRHAGDHRARRDAFERIRALNSAMLEMRRETLRTGRARLQRSLLELKNNVIARGREYFFGLFDRERLERLLEAVPTESDFRV